MKTPISTHQYKVGTCPACKFGVWADVDVEVEVHEPYLTPDGKAAANVSPRVVGMRVHHGCPEAGESS